VYALCLLGMVDQLRKIFVIECNDVATFILCCVTASLLEQLLILNPTADQESQPSSIRAKSRRELIELRVSGIL
jgi:hypothetical protein